jgi:hypothetical protein
VACVIDFDGFRRLIASPSDEIDVLDRIHHFEGRRPLVGAAAPKNANRKFPDGPT